MVSRSQIYLREHPSTLQLIKQVIYSWKWVPVLRRHFIQLTIIDAQMKGAILLLYKQYRSSPRRVTRPDEAFIQQFLNQFRQFHRCHPIRRLGYRRNSRIVSMETSISLTGGNPGNSSGNTSRNSLTTGILVKSMLPFSSSLTRANLAEQPFLSNFLATKT